MARQVSLIVEDGTIIPDSNSFASESEIVAYALARGVNLPHTTDSELDAVAILGIKSMDYLAIQPWKGEPVSDTQTTPWPRKNLGVTPPFPDNRVPEPVRQAQLQLTVLVNAGVELIPMSSGVGFLVKEKIGPIENVYSEKVGISENGLPILPGIEALLDPWLLGDLDGLIPVMIRSVGKKRGYSTC
jgi:hypothetical protein